MDCFVATGRPACPLLQEARVIDIRDNNLTAAALLLEMAFQTKRLVAFRQHPLINRPMGRMAGHTPFTERLVLEDKRTPLRRVTLEAGFVLAQQSHAATLERLWKVSPTPFDRVSLVRIMAIGTTHFPFEHRVVMRKLEFCAHFQMTLETSLRRPARVDDRAGRAATCDVETSRPMT